MESVREAKLGELMRHRKTFIQISDQESYKRCRVQLHAKGIVLRDTVKGSEIRTKQQQVCRLNDFVVAEMDAKFGGYGVIRNGLENAIVSSHYFLFEPDEEKLSIDYLELLCQTDIIQSQIKATGSTNYAAIRPYHVLDITVPLPDLPTQKNIVARLQSLQSLHREADATLARLQANVKRLRQSILQEAIQGKLVDYKPAPGEKTGAELLADIRAEKERRAREAGKKPEAPMPPVTPEEMPFELPEGWVWCRLGEVASFLGGFAFQSSSYVSASNFQVIRLGNVKNDFLNLESSPVFVPENVAIEADKFKILKGDILITMTGTRRKKDYCFTLLVNDNYLRNKVLFLN